MENVYTECEVSWRDDIQAVTKPRPKIISGHLGVHFVQIAIESEPDKL
jgi:hypothetical protein